MKKRKESKKIKLSKTILVLCIMSLFKMGIVQAEPMNLLIQQEQLQTTIKGKVYDKNGVPLPGVNVLLKGTKTATMTDVDGTFSINSSGSNNVLQFTLIGMKKLEVNISGKTNINVTMVEEEENLKEVVLIGYQKVQKKTVTASVATVKGKDIENIPYASVDQILAGRVAGLTALTTSGEPGSKTVTNIRGSNSVNINGVSYPLYVIDGMIYDVNDLPSAYGNNPLTALNPNEIESIDILKDASAAAIYGSRGANGVILIKTKKGATNQRPTFRFNAYTGVGLKPNLRKVIVGRMERQLKLDAIYNNYSGKSLSDKTFNMFLTDSLNVAFNNNTDWQDIFIQNSTIHNADASISGAFGKNQYRVSLGYYKEEGVITGYALKRLSPKIYLSLNPSDKVNFTVNIAPSFVDIDHGMGNGDTFPFNTWAFPSSLWNLKDKQKQALQGRSGNLDDDRTTSIMSNAQLNVGFTKDLQFSSSFSFNYRNNRRDWLEGKELSGGLNNIAHSWDFETTISEIENYFTYSKKIDNHNFSAILGQQASLQTNRNSELHGIGVLGNTIFDISAGPNLSGNSYLEKKSRLGIFGRLNYDFKEKYLFSSSYRRDASSRYNSAIRWTDFYSVSAGWNASEEAFFEPIKSVVNFLKFRGSYGVTGNDPASYYAQYNIYTGNATYDNFSLGANNYGITTTYNGTNVTAQNYGDYAGSKYVTWEKYPQVNIGMDLSMFNNRIQVNADWYARDAQQIFYGNLVAPSTSGYKFYSGNAVDIRNTGYEFTINTVNLGFNSTFKWNTTVTLAFNDNYVTKLPNNGKDLTVGAPWQQYTLTVGKPLFNYLVWETQGVYKSNEEVPTDPLTGNKMTYYGETIKVGDPKYVDKNGDYKIDIQDKTYAGSPNPKVSGGFVNTFQYKNWSMTVFCNFIYGRKIWNGYVSDKLNGSRTGYPWADWGFRATVATLQDINYYKGPASTDAEYGTLLSGGSYSNIDRFHIANSKFIEDGSFFRVKNITLGYNVKETIAKKLGLSALQFYGMIDNIAMFKKSTLSDPEAVGADGFTAGNNYPLTFKFTAGLTASF